MLTKDQIQEMIDSLNDGPLADLEGLRDEINSAMDQMEEAVRNLEDAQNLDEDYAMHMEEARDKLDEADHTMGQFPYISSDAVSDWDDVTTAVIEKMPDNC